MIKKERRRKERSKKGRMNERSPTLGVPPTPRNREPPSSTATLAKKSQEKPPAKLRNNIKQISCWCAYRHPVMATSQRPLDSPQKGIKPNRHQPLESPTITEKLPKTCFRDQFATVIFTASINQPRSRLAKLSPPIDFHQYHIQTQTKIRCRRKPLITTRPKV